MLWALHCELDKRDVSPCVRWPANTDTPQAEFITFLADLLWFCKRHPEHRAHFKGWRTLLKQAPASPGWHAAAHHRYLFVLPRYSLAHYCAKGMGLSDVDRDDLMSLPTNTMVADRRQLQQEKFEATRHRLLSFGAAHPDRSGLRAFDVTAQRRASLWRVYVLSRKRQAATVKNWALLSGETITRQSLARQLAIIDVALSGSM